MLWLVGMFTSFKCEWAYAGLWAGLPAGLGGRGSSSRRCTNRRWSTWKHWDERKAAQAHLPHKQPRLQWHTFPPQWQPGTWPTFLPICKRVQKSLLQPDTVPVTSEHHGTSHATPWESCLTSQDSQQLRVTQRPANHRACSKVLTRPPWQNQAA